MKTHLEMMKKHLEMFIDFKLNFREHSENMLNKVNKNIGLVLTLHSVQRSSSYYKSYTWNI